MLHVRRQSLQFAQKFDAKQIESQVREYLAKTDLRKEIAESSSRSETVRFIEGPPTMNGPPHAGHLRGRVIKDLWYRFSTLRGLHVIFTGGWDTQGLPIELQAEKVLGVTGGKAQAIRQFGVDAIVSECKKIVTEYTEQWVKTDRLLGISLDHDNSYRTLDDAYIEREWEILRRAKEIGVIKEDHTVIAYCPSCQTSLSHAEVGQGYKETTDPSLYYMVKLEPRSTGIDAGSSYGGDAPDTPLHLVVWTTMPFTLVTDALVGVHPDEEYVCVEITDAGDAPAAVSGKILVVGKTRLEDGVMSEMGIKSYKITRTMTGVELDGHGYVHPLRSLIPGLDAALKRNLDTYHTIVADSFVDVGTGSGLVHIAPANGEEDIRIASERGMEVFSPIDDEVRFTDDAGERYAGLFVRDADMVIVDDLKKTGSLAKIGRIRHSYPHCWRSGHALVWLARRGFFYNTEKIGAHVTAAADAVEYFFEQPKNRFLGIINDRHPWCISRERIWGCPLPAWVCNDCLKTSWFYSKKEIVDRAVYLPDGADFELHKPWIDNVRVRCDHCGGVNTTREDYVLDTWHNSGSAPWSSLDDDTYNRYVPVPFLTEGIDQTRGWAYTLLLESVILRNRPEAPFESFLFQGHVLDAKGQKMSKSKGNVLEGASMLATYPADMIRLYFMWKASPIEPLSFSVDEMMSRPHQILNTLYNLHLYHTQNSSFDGFDVKVHTIEWAKKGNLLQAPEVWLVSKLQGLISTVTEKNQTCRFHEAARALDDYIINVFSQTYVRMTRPEIWNEDDDNRSRRLAIYAAMYHVLACLDILMHPLCPYTTEYLWQTVASGRGAAGKRETGIDGGSGSILLEPWPASDPSMVDCTTEESFDYMTTVVSACSAARMSRRLKGRWPLDEAIICVDPGQASVLEPLAETLREQVNVERVVIREIKGVGGASDAERAVCLEDAGMPVVIKTELNGKSAGPKALQRMPALVAQFKDMPAGDVARSLSDNGLYDVQLPDGGGPIRLDHADVSVTCDASDGFAMAIKPVTILGASASGNNDSCPDAGSTITAAGDGNSSMAKTGSYVAVFVSTTRNEEMTARGLVKDIARRLQSLRKGRGYNPTDVLERASILDLTEHQRAILEDKKEEIAFLVRVRQVDFGEKTDSKEYKDDDIDGQKIRISVE